MTCILNMYYWRSINSIKACFVVADVSNLQHSWKDPSYKEMMHDIPKTYIDSVNDFGIYCAAQCL